METMLFSQQEQRWQGFAGLFVAHGILVVHIS